MLDDMRKYVRAGAEALAPGRSDDLAAALVSRAQAMAEQMSLVAGTLREWSAEARASLLREVKDIVGRQIREMGVATKADLDGLRRRVERLEERQEGRRTGGARGSGSRAKVRTTKSRSTKIRTGSS